MFELILHSTNCECTVRDSSWYKLVQAGTSWLSARPLQRRAGVLGRPKQCLTCAAHHFPLALPPRLLSRRRVTLRGRRDSLEPPVIQYKSHQVRVGGCERVSVWFYEPIETGWIRILPTFNTAFTHTLPSRPPAHWQATAHRHVRRNLPLRR